MRYFKIFLPVILVFMMLTAGATPNKVASNDFNACDDNGVHINLSDSQCIYIDTPLAHGTSMNDSINLFVRKFPARGEHQGEIWLIAGGPGESGASFYAEIDFFRRTFPNYDVMVPDHRGTGYSSKLCMPEETLDSPDGLALAAEEWGTCFQKLYSNLKSANSFSQRNAAHDLDKLITTLGSNNKTMIYGVSYGTSLVLEYTKLATTNVDGIILDSLTPASSDNLNGLSYRSQTTDRVGKALLDRCAADTKCSLGTRADETYRALLKEIDDGAEMPGLNLVPDGNLRQFLGLLLDVPKARNQIPNIIRALSTKDPAAKTLIKDVIESTEAYWGRILQFKQSTSSIPLSAIISGSEFNSRPDLTAEIIASENAELGFTSPLSGLLSNNQFPLYQSPKNLPLPSNMPPLLILQGTFDSKTPYDAAVERATNLRVHGSVEILTLIDAPHAAYVASQDCLAKPLLLFANNPKAVVSQTCTPAEVSVGFQ